jgi:hypothetical protein
MTRDDIIRMAREAGFLGYESRAEEAHNFAALVAAPLQERIQLLYEQLNEAEKQLGQQYKLGMEAEREACAKVCDDTFYSVQAADAIRARGNA